MSGKRKHTTRVYLTERALRDIADIEEYSISEFGQRVATRYIGKLEAALRRITEQPDLLESEPELHSWLRFYRVGKHLMVCDIQSPTSITVLTFIHASMDVPSRLVELEPALVVETKLLHRRLHDES